MVSIIQGFGKVEEDKGRYVIAVEAKEDEGKASIAYLVVSNVKSWEL